MNRLFITGVAFAMLCGGVGAFEGDFALPEGAATVDVTKPPYNAVGDGKTDCTEAFNKAIKASRAASGHRLVYVPDGVYLLSCTQEKYEAELAALKPGQEIGALVGWRGEKKTVLQGQSRERTILKLADNCPSFTDPRRPRWVLDAGKAGSNDFNNGIHNITIDTGKGNPGAKGMKFHTSNQGAATNILVRSGDGQGAIGFDLRAAGPGPGLVKHLRVEGFARGISSVYDGGFTMTFEDIELVGQSECGFYIDALPCSIHGLKSVNNVTAVRVARPMGCVFLVDAELSTPAPDKRPPTMTRPASRPGDPPLTIQTPAIENMADGAVYARNVATGGYAVAVRSVVDGKATEVAGPKVDLFTSHPIRTCVPNASPKPLALEIEPTPQVPYGDLSDWISVKEFQPRKIDYKDSNGRARSVVDWTEAVQKAIDSGKGTVYFPNDTYWMTGTIHVRGNVKRIMGCESSIGFTTVNDLAAPPASAPADGDDADVPDDAATKPAPKPALAVGFRFEDGPAPVVVFERVYSCYGSRVGNWFEQATKRTVVIKHVGAGGFINTVPGGKVFFEDFCGGNVQIDHMDCWMRQFNPEAKGGADSFNCRNIGGRLWILGIKTEGPKTVITTLDGGKTELIGGQIYPNRGSDGEPAFVCKDSVQSLSYMCDHGWMSGEMMYEEHVREILGDRTYSLWRGDCFKRGGRSYPWGGVFMPLYTGVGGKGGAAEPGGGAPPETCVLVRPTEPAKFAPALPSTAPAAFYRGGLGRTGFYADTKAVRVPAGGLDANKNAVPKWKFEVGNAKAGVCSPVVAGETVYFGDRYGSVYAVNAADGSKKWKYEGKTGLSGPPAVAQGRVFIGAGDDFLCLDAQSGELKWQAHTAGVTCYEPAVVGNAVLFVSLDGWLRVTDVDGKEMYRLSLPREVASGVAVEGGRAFVGLRGGVQAVDIATGATPWFFRCGASVCYPIVSGGTLYAPAEKIYAVDVATGKEVWSRKVFPNTDPRACLAEGVLYVGAPRRGGLTPLDARTGEPRSEVAFTFGKYNWKGAYLVGPAIAEKTIYGVMMNGWNLSACDAVTGELLWTYPSGYNSTPAVAGGVLYIGQGASLVAIE